MGRATPGRLWQVQRTPPPEIETAMPVPSSGLGCSQAPTQGGRIAECDPSVGATYTPAGIFGASTGRRNSPIRIRHLPMPIADKSAASASWIPFGNHPMPNGAVRYLPHMSVKGI